MQGKGAPSPAPYPRKRRFAHTGKPCAAVQILCWNFCGLTNYKAIRGNGVFPPQTIEVLLPVTVVAHDARVTKSAEYARAIGSPSDSGGAGAIVLLVLLAPLLIPLLILQFFVGGITGQDFGC